jgi:glycosyltransferase involved in cell wall biosynthesis
VHSFQGPPEKELSYLGHEIISISPGTKNTVQRSFNRTEYSFKPNLFDKTHARILLGSGSITGLIAKAIPYILQSDFQLVQTYYAYPAGFAGALLKRLFPSLKLVITVSGWDVEIIDSPDEYGARWSRRHRAMISFALRSADRVVAPSAFGEKLAIAAGADPSKIRIIPCAWYFTRDLDSVLRGQPITHDGPIVLAPCRQIPKKGLLDLIEAMAVVKVQVPQARLIITGSSTDHTNALLRAIRRLGLTDNVTFAGEVSENGLISLFQRATLVCQPSISDIFCISALEGMANGKPIVITESVGLASFIRGKNVGIIVHRSRPDELAKAIVSLISNDSLRESMGREGKIMAQMFTPAKVAGMYSSLYSDLALSGAGAS